MPADRRSRIRGIPGKRAGTATSELSRKTKKPTEVGFFAFIDDFQSPGNLVARGL
jgi:hypothetical protein